MPVAVFQGPAERTIAAVEGMGADQQAAARDFADVYGLAGRLGKDMLLARAALIDAGFDAMVLAAHATARRVR